MESVVWAIVGVLFVLSEFVVPGFVVFFFGVGGLLNALLVALIPGLSGRIPVQLLIWAASSGLALAFLRRIFSRAFRGTLLDSDSRFVGETAEVAETIGPEAPGRVRFEGTTWTAVSYDETIEPGEKVSVIEKQGTTLIVTRSFLSNDIDKDS